MTTDSGTLLLARRLNLGLTRTSAAKAMGISERQLRYAESGFTPRPPAMKKIADYYGQQVTDIWPVEVAA